MIKRKFVLFALITGACLLVPATAPAAAQSSGCELTPAPVNPNTVAPPVQYMLADVTDACPLVSYHDYNAVLTGEYDATTLDYVRFNYTFTKMPQQTEEVMVLMPTGGVSWYRDDPTTGQYTRAIVDGVPQMQLPPDPNPPFGRWQPGLSKAEMAREGIDQAQAAGAPHGQTALQYLAALQGTAWSKTLTTTDGCGTPVANVSFRIVQVTDTCTEAMFPRLADPLVPNYAVGGTQFASTTPNGNPWLLGATATRDDGNGELLFLVPVASPDGDPNLPGVPGPPTTQGLFSIQGALPAGKVNSPFMPAPASTSGHDYYVSWIAGGKII
jgi:hypothetical protein